MEKPIVPAFPEGMRPLDTSKLDKVKVDEMLAKLKGVKFATDASQLQGNSSDDTAIEGVDVGTTRNKPDLTGTKPRISFKRK